MDNKNKHLNRRTFLSKSFASIASAGILGSVGRGVTKTAAIKEIAKSDQKIVYRTLGNTGLRMPVVNMGVMNTMDAALVKRSYEIGVRHFDTAMSYRRGLNEEMVGQAITEMGVRNEVIIATKVLAPAYRQDMSEKGAKEKFVSMTEESLKRLKTDYVDILYLHVVDSGELVTHPGVLEAMRLLKEQGKARFIGFTTHANMTVCLNEAARLGFHDVILTAINYAMCEDNELLDAMKQATSKGIGLIAMKTQCKQPWYFKRHESSEKRKFYEGKIMHPALLKWVLKYTPVTSAVPGYTSFQEMEEDFSVAYDLNFTEAEKQFLEDRDVKLSLSAVCQRCGYCIGTCPQSVDIPNLMRTHMYAACYSNFFQARDTLESILKDRGLKACDSCSKCRARCIRHVDIPCRIDELKAIYG